MEKQMKHKLELRSALRIGPYMDMQLVTKLAMQLFS